LHRLACYCIDPLYRFFIVASAAAAAMALASAASALYSRRLLHLFQLRLFFVVASAAAAIALIPLHLLL
jgi:hypothetical protein